MKENSLLAIKIENAEKAARDERVKKFLENQAAAARLRQAVSAGFKDEQPKKVTRAQRLDAYAAAFKNLNPQRVELEKMGWKFSSTQQVPAERTTRDIYVHPSHPHVMVIGYKDGFYFTNGMPNGKQPAKEWHELGTTLLQFNNSPMAAPKLPAQKPNWINPSTKKLLKDSGWVEAADMSYTNQRKGLVLHIASDHFQILKAGKDGKVIEKGTGIAALEAAILKV